MMKTNEYIRNIFAAATEALIKMPPTSDLAPFEEVVGKIGLALRTGCRDLSRVGLFILGYCP